VTNQELAKYLDNTGVKNLATDELEHVALRFIEIFRHGEKAPAVLNREVTSVPHVVS